LNLGLDDDKAMREYLGKSFDGNPPLQLFEHADYLAG